MRDYCGVTPGRRGLAASLVLGLLAVALALRAAVGGGLGLTEAEAAVRAEVLRRPGETVVEVAELREVARPGRAFAWLAEEPDAAVKVTYRVAEATGGRRRREAIGFVRGGRVLALLGPEAGPTFDAEDRRLFAGAR